MRACTPSIVLFAALLSVSCAGGNPSYSPSYAGAQRVDVSLVEFEDGDTFAYRGEVIRVLGIDTPETKHEAVGILYDQPYGPAASESTRVWITRAGVVEIVRDGPDRYGRRLAHVFVDGELLAERLLRHALAYETVSAFGDNGFPDLADRILATAAASPKPPFQEPYQWRRKNQKRAAP